jgi:hypothetical protein
MKVGQIDFRKIFFNSEVILKVVTFTIIVHEIFRILGYSALKKRLLEARIVEGGIIRLSR